ncbi:MAG: zf-TFIIB domain-containing protein [Gemmatimonadota bacterium]
MPTKPSHPEDEYFLKLDAELIKAHRARLDAERTNTERRAHYMKCPKCGANLVETDYHHVKVDVCNECKGMWLDAGELEMIAHVKEDNVGGFLRDLLRGLPGK